MDRGRDLSRRISDHFNDVKGRVEQSGLVNERIYNLMAQVNKDPGMETKDFAKELFAEASRVYGDGFSQRSSLYKDSAILINVASRVVEICFADFSDASRPSAILAWVRHDGNVSFFRPPIKVLMESKAFGPELRSFADNMKLADVGQ
ncbi:MAG: hypothetical protein KGH98_03410 [Candidatus Micrarchaeota archaeon]|nr:hypothetical protein [Candidatus Micrarchaeota archaeon]